MDTTLSVSVPLLPLYASETSETVPVSQRIKGKDKVCKQVGLAEGYEVQTCHKYMAITLREDVRKASLTPYVSKTLKSENEQRNWKIASFRCVEDDLTDMKPWQEMVETVSNMKATEETHRYTSKAHYANLHHKSAISLLSDNTDITDVFLCNPSPEKTFDTIPIDLPSLKSVPEGKQIMVFYNRAVPSLEDDEDFEYLPGSPEPEAATKTKAKGTCQKGPSVALNPTAKERDSSNTVNNLSLSPQECAVYIKRNGKWHVRFKMVERGEALNPNPLLRLSGPLVVNKKDELHVVPDDGEYFLNQTIIRTLYEQKVKAHQTQSLAANADAPMEWDYLLSNSASGQLQKLDRKAAQSEKRLEETAMDTDQRSLSDGYSYQFFFERWNACHVIGSFVHVTDSDVFVYLHETEGAGNATAKRIRGHITALLQKVHPDKKLTVCYPKDPLQKDFASCGVFAMKVMNYFRKNPDVMTQWLVSMHESEIQQQEKDAQEAGDMYEQPKLIEHPVFFEELKPGLLKMFNGKLQPSRKEDPVFTSDQLHTTVSHKKDETLKGYLWKYETSKVKKPNGQQTTVNVGSTAKRLAYLAKYEQFMKDNHAHMRLARKRVRIDKEAHWNAYPFEVVDFSLAAPGAKRDKTESSAIYHGAPDWVLKSESFKEVNDWLKEVNSEPFTKMEWKHLLNYYTFSANDGSIPHFSKKHPAAAAWLIDTEKHPLTHPLTDAKWFLVDHWRNDGITGLPHKSKRSQHKKKKVSKTKKGHSTRHLDQ